jgi:CMP-N-acetylneuraminic acid synthetase
MSEDSTKSLVLISARGGSRGIPKKNIAMLGGAPLIAWSIKAALEAKNVDRVVVSTDSEEIAAIAKEWGADVPFIRPENLSGDSASLNDVMKHSMELINPNNKYRNVLNLFPTSPFRTPELIEHIIDLLNSSALWVSTSIPHSWDPSFWFYKNGQTAEPISSKQPGYFVRPIGLVFAGHTFDWSKYPHLVAGDPICWTRHFSSLGDPKWNRHSFPSKTVLIYNPIMATDIDTPKDLEKANQAVSDNKVPWSPIHGQLLPGKEHWDNGRDNYSNVNSNSIFISLANSRPSVQKKDFDFSKSLTPIALRNYIDQSFPEFKEQAITISDRTPSDNPQETPLDPSITLDETTIWRPHSLRMLKCIAFGNFYSDSEVQKELGCKPGLLHSQFNKNNFSLSIDLPFQPKIYDLIHLYLCDNTGKKISIAAYEYNNGSWNFSHLLPGFREFPEVPISGIDKNISWRCSKDTYFGTIHYLRPGFSEINIPSVTEAIEIEGRITYQRSTNSWLNAMTNERILGRQWFLPIYSWGGYLYLPKSVTPAAKWSIIDTKK